MSTGIEHLSALCDQVAYPEADRGLPPETLRFVLEFASLPDLELQRSRLGELLGTDRFDLEFLFEDPTPFDDDEGVFVVLQIPGLEPTSSRAGLFGMAYGLAQELDLRSAEPDLGSDLFAEDSPDSVADGAQTEGTIGRGANRLCFVEDEPPVDRQWALKTLKVPEAWAIATRKGEGILIGQPDTGVADHNELEAGSLDIDRGTDIVDGDENPTDPRTGGNSGHGTGTASVVVSSGVNDIVGSAPGAKVVPIRCVEKVVVFNAAPVARAVDHARRNGCHIITMSLGGLPSWGLRTAVRRAVKSNIIVLAAAGNCVKTVVWPARFSDVIAVGACTIDLEPWRGTCRGKAVDVTAPGELVWKARFDAETGAPEIGGGQGTSFGVALTAGIAALWLDQHGPEAIEREAAEQRVTVQELFRRLVRDTAQTPAGWQHHDLGSGIVDAEALLGAPLHLAEREGIDHDLVTSESIDDGLADALEERFPGNRVGVDDSTDWRRYNLELASAVVEDLRRGTNAGIETGSERLSEELRSALARATSRPLRRIGRRPAGISQPSGPASAPLVDPVRRIAMGTDGGLESVAEMTIEQARNSLDDQSIEQRLGRLDAVFKAARADEVDSDRLATAQKEVLDDAARVLTDLREGRAVDPEDIDGRTGLEALIKMHGRPVIPILGDAIDLRDDRLGQWEAKIIVMAPFLNDALGSVGRINTGGAHTGTGFMIAEDLIMTNRHVLESLASAIPSHEDPEPWELEATSTINFDPAGVDPNHSFKISEVVFAGPRRIIGSPLDFSKLDLAVLRIETTNSSGTPAPPALPISTEAAKTETGDELFLIGYPAMPTRLPRDDEGQIRLDVSKRLQELFGLRYSAKYLSPGAVIEDTATFDRSVGGWVFSHDATSLGGNSGSCVLSFDRELAVSGLHFAGDWLHANFAHDLGAVSRATQTLPAELAAVFTGRRNP